MELNPTEIFESVKDNRLDRLTAVSYLKLLVENSNSNKIRMDALDFLVQLGTKDNNNIFEILENILIADEDFYLRFKAMNLLVSNYCEKARKPLEWIAKNEIFSYKLKKLYIFLENSNLSFAKDLMNIILQRYANYFGVIFEEAKFFFDIIEDLDILNNSICSGRSEDLDSQGAWFIVKDNRTVSLSLFINGLEIVPESINFLTELRYLYINNIKLENVSKYLLNLQNLEKIYIHSDENLKEAPDWLYDLCNSKFSRKYIEKGVAGVDASVLALFDVFIGSHFKDLDNCTEADRYLPGYSLNENGNIKILDLNGSESFRIYFIPEQISKLKNLEELRSCNNYIKKIPESIGKLRFLRCLHLDNNEIAELPDSIGELKNLEHLSLGDALGGNCLTEFPESITRLKKLKYLSLDDNNIQIIPHFIGKLKSLKSLSLSRNPIENLPDSIGKLKKLDYLSIDKTNVRDLPFSMKKLKNLEIFEFYGQLPKPLEPYLSPAVLWNNREQNFIRDLVKKKIPRKFTTVLGFLYKHLEDFKVVRCKKGKRHEKNIYLIRCDRELKIDDNYINHFKKELNYCYINEYKRVVGLYLSISGCCNSDLAFYSQIQRLKHLEKLHITDGSNVELPDWIGNLSNLRELKINYFEKLKRVPNFLEKLKNLKLLDLSSNNLENLSESVFKLINLEILDLSFNNLKEISESAFRLKNLKVLNLNNNMIKTFHAKTFQLLSLKKIGIDHYMLNNVSNFPKFVMDSPLLNQIDLTLNYKVENDWFKKGHEIELKLELPLEIKEIVKIRGINVDKYIDGDKISD